MTRCVIITGARAPVAVHLARRFREAGWRVLLADALRFPIGAATRVIAGYRRFPAPRQHLAAFAEFWRRLLVEERPDLVVPTCEEIFYLAALRECFGLDLPLFAPPFETLAAVHHKGRFAALAAGFGADPPETVILEAPGTALPFPETVLKPAWSRFGSRVLIRLTPAAFARLVPTPAAPWVAQRFVPGEEICAYGVAIAGALTAFAAYRPLWRAGLGAAVAFEPLVSPAAETFTHNLVKHLAWTGQIAFDFRHDEAGQLRVLECNPRATSGAHFFGPGDGLVEAICGRGTAQPSLRQAMTLPLALLVYGLPLALRRGEFARLVRDFRTMANLLADPADRSFLPAQGLALAEIAARAVCLRTGLKEAATADIEWDGEPLTSPS